MFSVYAIDGATGRKILQAASGQSGLPVASEATITDAYSKGASPFYVTCGADWGVSDTPVGDVLSVGEFVRFYAGAVTETPAGDDYFTVLTTALGKVHCAPLYQVVKTEGLTTSYDHIVSRLEALCGEETEVTVTELNPSQSLLRFDGNTVAILAGSIEDATEDLTGASLFFRGKL